MSDFLIFGSVGRSDLFSVICCIWRSNEDLKPNPSHNTDIFIYLKKEKLTQLFHILGSVPEGNTTKEMLA